MSRHHYPIRVPRYAAGVRAQEPRGSTLRNWWARRWQAALEAMNLGSRLGRGRAYAMSGQVISIVRERSRILAKIVGTRVEPYLVTLDFRPLESAAKTRVVKALRQDPMLIARLAADDLPLEVEGLMRANGVDLFPGGKLGPKRYDMTSSCNCPDYANPCKHVTAVMLLLGEEIARHPLTLLALRGIEEGELYED